jgi:glycosyltransferase involved in cell wall biosynthesis
VPRHVHGEHGWDVHDLYGSNSKYLRYRRWMRPFVDRYVAVSHDIAQWLVSRVGVREDRVIQIYNGVDATRFRPLRSTARASGWPFPTDGSVIVVGTVGRMQPVKDPLNLVRAFVSLTHDESLRRRLRLAMVGDATPACSSSPGFPGPAKTFRTCCALSTCSCFRL